MAQILQEQYGLKPEDKIVVFWMREVSLPHFNRYRIRKVYSGLVKYFQKRFVNNE